MTTLRETWMRVVAFFRKDALDRDVDEELEAHVALATEEHVRRGMREPEARRRALIELGGILPAKQLHRESRGLPSLDAILQDIRYAIRGLRRSPGFTLTAVATLAIAIGVNAAVFTVTNAVFLKSSPLVDRGDRLLYVERPGAGHSYAELEALRATATSFTAIGAATAWLASIRDEGGLSDLHELSVISANAFALIGQRPALGRDFAAFDTLPGAAPVVILSDRLWARRYGRDPGVIGRTVRLEASAVSVLPGDAATIIGVMPPRFWFPFDSDLWAPLMQPTSAPARQARMITFFFGRLADDVTVHTARTELERLGRQIATADLPSEQTSVAVQDFNEHFVGNRAATMFAALCGAVTCIVLIACVNVANLVLARGIGRSRELSMRMALGAGRWRIARQGLVEGLVVSMLAGCVAWPIASLAIIGYERANFTPFNYRHYVDLSMDGQVLGYIAIVSVVTGLLFGLAPMFRLSRLGIAGALKDGGRGTTDGPRARRASALLLAGEVALALVLLAGAGMMMRSALNIYMSDIGVETADVLMADLGLSIPRYPTADAQVAFHDALTARLQGVPGVLSVAVADRYPTQGTRRLPYETFGDRRADDGTRPHVATLRVSPGYVRTLGADVLAGREFTRADTAWSAPVALVNRRFASLHWPGRNPVGQRLRLDDDGATPGVWRTIVGVVSDIVQGDDTRQVFAPAVYIPYVERPTPWMYVFVRTAGSVEGVAATLRREMAVLDPGLPVSFSTLTERLAQNYGNRAVYGLALLTFAAIGLLLAAVGLSGAVARLVSQRTQEIGVRMAMGATARHILALVSTNGMRPVAIGLFIGFAVTVSVTPLLRSQLVNVSPADPLTLVCAAAVLVTAALLGCLIPVRRAMRVDPVVALRHE